MTAKIKFQTRKPFSRMHTARFSDWGRLARAPRRQTPGYRPPLDADPPQMQTLPGCRPPLPGCHPTGGRLPSGCRPPPDADPLLWTDKHM